MNELTFVLFSEDDLPDYMDVILPNVWDELLTLESFDEAGVIPLAAELDGQTVGAAVATVFENGEAQVYSIYVRPEYRRMKVGTALLDELLLLVRERLDDPELPEIPVVEVVDYTMAAQDGEGFTAFLKSAGFKFFDELPALYILSGEAAKSHAATPADVTLLSELTEEEKAAVEEVLEGYGIPAGPELSACAGDQEHSCMAFTVPSYDDDYVITSHGENADEQQYRALLARIFAAIAAQAETFSILADGTRNLFPEVWENLGAEAYRRTIARRNVLFES